MITGNELLLVQANGNMPELSNGVLHYCKRFKLTLD